MAKCNLPAHERDGILHAKTIWEHSADELDRCRAFFEQYLFIELPGWDKSVRICTCSNCDQAWAVNRKENKAVFSLHHGDQTECPHCGRALTVQLLGRLGKGNKLYQTAAVSFVNVDRGAVCIESGIAFDDYYCDYSYGEARPRMEVSFIAKRRYYMRPARSWAGSGGSGATGRGSCTASADGRRHATSRSRSAATECMAMTATGIS